MFDGQIKRSDRLNSSEPPSHDWQELLKRFDHDMELISELIEMLLECRQERVSQLMTALEKNDLETIDLAAHSLIGVSSYFNGTRVQNVARLIVDQARAGKDENLRSMITQLTQELNRLCNDLSQRMAS